MLPQFLQRPSVFHFEITNAGPSQRFQAGAVAQGLAEVVGEAADIGAFAARHLKVEFGEAVEAETEVVDADITGLQFYLLVGAGVVEGAFPLDLDSGILGRVLLDVAHKLPPRRLDLFRRDALGGEKGVGFALQVEGRGGLAQEDRACVGLDLRLERVDLLGHLACAKDEQAGGQGVEGAGMAHFQLADAVAAVHQRADKVDRVERRPVQGFVDEDDLAFFEIEHIVFLTRDTGLRDAGQTQVSCLASRSLVSIL